MIFALSEAMDVPMRERNALMLAAGFAPSFPERPLGDPQLDSVRSAIDHILQAHEPYPAIVFDWRHDILAANVAAYKLLMFLFDVYEPEELPEFSKNLLRALMHPDGLRNSISNWSQTASTLLRRLQAEIRSGGDREEGIALLNELASYPGIPSDWRQCADLEWRKPVLTLEISKAGRQFRLFSTLTMLGAPFDVTLQEIRIETFFPADEHSKVFFLA